jgi:proteic killer suppression protein
MGLRIMILSISHKGLALFYETGQTRGIQAIHAARLRELLSALSVASSPNDLKRPSWRLHQLSGNRTGFYAMTVKANWRLTFRFADKDIELLNYLDYH